MPGGHAWSADGIAWSNISGSNGELAQHGCFNLSRPNKAVHCPVVNATHCTNRPKLLFATDRTTAAMHKTVCVVTRGFTIAEPLGRTAE